MKMNKITSRRNWTEAEMLMVIGLYNYFLHCQNSQEKYQKAQPVRDMAERLGRSKSSIECLLMNISAIRQNLYSLDIVKGYKALDNYSKSLLVAYDKNTAFTDIDAVA